MAITVNRHTAVRAMIDVCTIRHAKFGSEKLAFGPDFLGSRKE
jgi:hypothetical protein